MLPFGPLSGTHAMKLHHLPALLPLLASSLSAGSLLWAANAQAAAAQPADDAADAQTRCSDLKEVELPDVVIQRVKWVQRGGLAQDPNSAFTGASGHYRIHEPQPHLRNLRQ